MTKKEYIESLTIEDLRELVDIFSAILHDENLVYYNGHDPDEISDCGPWELGFLCPETGVKLG